MEYGIFLFLDLIKEGGTSNDEREGKRESEEGVEGTSRKFDAAKGKGTKAKGGKSKKKQERKPPATVHVAQSSTTITAYGKIVGNELP